MRSSIHWHGYFKKMPMPFLNLHLTKQNFLLLQMIPLLHP